ncbi:NAD(+) synthase [Salimicrobium flavidum]|uniref:NH(3)-dependent NAD(+) synthetase n=1 Tax=Salimicrobium flavidum TaxID=570947 RepID=A0A1N7IHY1_9BACI|nr:NAD(+) synthase [Salimicrobium flavidum]SIS36668.1 NAD+ synthase [Salimicrobium flavidum]
MEQEIEKLTKWLQEKIKEANAEGLLVGLSGGIDSAVVANLIKRACPEASLGVIMPCKSDGEDEQHAKEVAEACGIKTVTIDLTTTHDTLLPTIQKQLRDSDLYKEEAQQLADANLRARLRMSTLYTVGANTGYLVTGTDNAAEWYTGYFTKYGDGGVDLVPLTNYTKGEVREMARDLGVPSSIVEKKPSAGLWEGQTDENEMGTSYATIDRYLKGEAIPEKDKEIIDSLHKRSHHKRQMPPAPPKDL